MEAQSLVNHQHSWWFSCFSLREKLARSHKKKNDYQSFFNNIRKTWDSNPRTLLHAYRVSNTAS